MPFWTITDYYKRRSLITTTNIEFRKWRIVFDDYKLTATAIARLIHHRKLVKFNGTSKRIEETLMLEEALIKTGRHV